MLYFPHSLVISSFLLQLVPAVALSQRGVTITWCERVKNPYVKKCTLSVANAFPMTRRAVLPTPIGRTPGHLSRAISRQATRTDVPFGSTYSEQSLLAVLASDSHRSTDTVLKEVHMCFHAAASRPEGQAAPSIFNTVLLINCPSITSNMTGCGAGGGESGSIRADGLGGCLGGSFFSGTLQTVSKLSFSGSTTLSNGSVPIPLLSVTIGEQHELFLPSSALQISLPYLPAA